MYIYIYIHSHTHRGSTISADILSLHLHFFYFIFLTSFCIQSHVSEIWIVHDLQYFLMKWEAIILQPYKTTSFQSAGASISHLTLHLALCLFDLVISSAVNHNIYLLFFPGDSSSVWSILILVFCLLWPGLTSVERHLEVTAMADCVPFLGVEDLREILTTVLDRKARTVQECRPLKVTNYLLVRDATSGE